MRSARTRKLEELFIVPCFSGLRDEKERKRKNKQNSNKIIYLTNKPDADYFSPFYFCLIIFNFLFVLLRLLSK